MTDIAQYLSPLSPMEKQTFSRFLKNKKAKLPFIRNFSIDNPNVDRLKRHLHLHRPETLAELINWAFYWMDTTEGYMFWYKLDLEWRKTVLFREY